ncbi:MAG: hypothetical protein KKD18_05950 [Nanoarchaeota archaeon]|nr:hypothetical protein [Nanoarchaeota archaeon]MBU0977934.1 hypothetical protein [Nanoarchaeota archaeon]
MKYLKLVVFAVIALIFIALAVYTTFFQAPRCQSFECFGEYMRQCKPVQYMNDGEEATWRYKVLGMKGGACVVEVTLLQPKAGELGIEKLSGYSMECGYPKGIVTYPERDLGSCSGKLKEEMQEIIIKKLHTYIIDNIGEIDDSLNLLVEQNS